MSAPGGRPEAGSGEGATGRPLRLDFRGWLPGEDELLPVIEHLRAGGLLAYPTETVYGLGCLLREDALARLLALKRAGGEKPLLLLVPGKESVAGLAWTEEAAELAGVFWPGAVTLVLPDPEGRYPPAVRSREGNVAVRVSSHPLVRNLVALLGEPLTSTSANRPGEAPAADGETALAAALALGAGEELWVLDAGALPRSAPSTIVDCAAGVPRVLREGATPVRRLRCVLKEIVPPERESDEGER